MLLGTILTAGLMSLWLWTSKRRTHNILADTVATSSRRRSHYGQSVTLVLFSLFLVLFACVAFCFPQPLSNRAPCICFSAKLHRFGNGEHALSVGQGRHANSHGPKTRPKKEESR